MLEFYRKFGLEERFWQTVRTIQNEFELSPLRDLKYYRLLCELDIELINFFGINSSYENDANINTYNHHLDIANAIEKLEAYSALKIQKITANFSEEIHLPLIEALLQLVQPGKPLNNPISELYRVALEMLEKKFDETDLNYFLTLVQNAKEKVNFEDHLTHMFFFRYFFDRLAIPSPNLEDRYKRYLLYKSHHEKGYFTHNGCIINNDLLVLLQLATRNKDHAWAHELLNTYSPSRILGTKYPEEFYSLLWADYFYYVLKDYDQVINKIEMRLFENPIYSILADILLIKIYFDLQNELLDYRMKSMYQKVRRTQMSDFIKGRYFNFLRHLERIQKYRLKNIKKKKEQILEGIRVEKNIYERDWLVEKLSELK